MEVKQSAVFTFSTAVDGQTFAFTMPGENRAAAARDLERKLSAIVKELQSDQNSMKAGAAS